MYIQVKCFLISEPGQAFLRIIDSSEKQTKNTKMNSKESTESEITDRIGLNVASILSAVLYGTCSVMIAFVNKLLMTTFEFNYPIFIMASQMLFTIVVLEVLSMPLVRIINMPRYTLERGKMFALPAMFYGINSVLALSALSHMNIALYGVLKRCVPLITLVLSTFILRKGWPSKLTIGSVVSLTVGCIIAGM